MAKATSLLVMLGFLGLCSLAQAQFFTPLPGPTASSKIKEEDYAYGLSGYLRDRD